MKHALGFGRDADDKEVLKRWKNASTRVCKPCWELKYCPYSPLVEQFPLLSPLRASAIEHNEYLVRIIAQGTFDTGEVIDSDRLAFFTGQVATFNPENYPESIPDEISDMSCRIFGHICPVVFSAEGVTETTEERRTGRNISPRVMMRVARRDNYMCQICNESLKDFDIEFDHIIPITKGGSSEEPNLRVLCVECNRKKSSKVTI